MARLMSIRFVRSPRCAGSVHSSRPGGRPRVAFDHAEDVGFLEDQPLLTLDQHPRTCPFAEQHAITGLDGERDDPAGFVRRTRTNREHLAAPNLSAELGFEI